MAEFAIKNAFTRILARHRSPGITSCHPRILASFDLVLGRKGGLRSSGRSDISEALDSAFKVRINFKSRSHPRKGRTRRTAIVRPESIVTAAG